MKNKLTRLAGSLGMTAMLSAMILMAQTATKTGTAEIPFGFEVQGRALPAGTYTMQELGTSGAVILRNTQSNDSIAVMAPPNKAGKGGEPKLVFTEYGDRYFLSQIWFQNEEAGHMLLKSRAEKELASKTAGVAAAIRLK